MALISVLNYHTAYKANTTTPRPSLRPAISCPVIRSSHSLVACLTLAEANFPRRTTNQIGAVAHWRVMSTVWNSRPQSVLRRRHFVDEPAVPLFLGTKKTAHTFALWNQWVSNRRRKGVLRTRQLCDVDPMFWLRIINKTKNLISRCNDCSMGGQCSGRTTKCCRHWNQTELSKYILDLWTKKSLIADWVSFLTPKNMFLVALLLFYVTRYVVATRQTVCTYLTFPKLSDPEMLYTCLNF